jgi:hypothetical protein
MRARSAPTGSPPAITRGCDAREASSSCGKRSTRPRIRATSCTG